MGRPGNSKGIGDADNQIIDYLTKIATPVVIYKKRKEILKENKSRVPYEEMTKLKYVCKDYMNDLCNRENCKFIHDSKLCKRFWRCYYCKYGDNCKKSHYVNDELYIKAKEIEKTSKENYKTEFENNYKIYQIQLRPNAQLQEQQREVQQLQLNLQDQSSEFQEREQYSELQERQQYSELQYSEFQERQQYSEFQERKKYSDLQESQQHSDLQEREKYSELQERQQQSDLQYSDLQEREKYSELQEREQQQRSETTIERRLKEFRKFVKKDSIEKKSSLEKIKDGRIGKIEKVRPRKFKNTETFKPMTKPVDMRVLYDLGSYHDKLSKKLKTRDVLLVPNLFRDFEENDIYNKLLDELQNCGIPEDKVIIPWHGNNEIAGTHMIASDWEKWKKNAPTFNIVINRIREFFNMDIKATRLNIYQNTAQWKAFHFDAAKINPEKAKIQNFTVCASFGRTRDCAFELDNTHKTVLSFPIGDGEIYCFARETNELWRHGVLQEMPQVNDGRISIVAWGWLNDVEEVMEQDVKGPN